MEDLSYSNYLDHEAVSSIDDFAHANTEESVRRSFAASPAYRAAGLLDGLSAYAAVFGCPGNCAA